MKKRTAVFTIVKDEKFFLPIWLEHYKRFFDPDDIYILNHQTGDGSCERTGVNVFEVRNEMAVCHFWLVQQVQDFQKKLLDSYEVVVFCEVDEIIYSLTSDLRERLDSFARSGDAHCNVHSHEIVHDIDSEGDLILGVPIMEQRKKWFHWPIYDKPLITKIPLLYEPGFHRSNMPNNFGSGFHMVHLHRLDFRKMLERHKWRVSRWDIADEGILGHQFKIGDEEGVLKLLNDHPELELISNEHASSLAHLVAR